MKSLHLTPTPIQNSVVKFSVFFVPDENPEDVHCASDFAASAIASAARLSIAGAPIVAVPYEQSLRIREVARHIGQGIGAKVVFTNIWWIPGAEEAAKLASNLGSNQIILVMPASTATDIIDQLPWPNVRLKKFGPHEDRKSRVHHMVMQYMQDADHTRRRRYVLRIAASSQPHVLPVTVQPRAARLPQPQLLQPTRQQQALIACHT